jgi:DNA ligase-1
VIRFARLLDDLLYSPSRLAKLALMKDYFASAPEPDRGYALAALAGTIEVRTAKPALIRALVSERVDPVLFDLSYDFVGDLAETTALIWPGQPDGAAPPLLSDVVTGLNTAGKSELPRLLESWLDRLEPTSRWALRRGLRARRTARHRAARCRARLLRSARGRSCRARPALSWRGAPKRRRAVPR